MSRTRAKPDGRPSRLCRRWMAESFPSSASIASYFGPRNLRTSCVVARYGRPRSCSAEGPSSSSSNGAGAAACAATAAGCATADASALASEVALVMASVRASEPGARVTDSLPGWPERTKRLELCCSQLRRPPLSLTSCLAFTGTKAPRSESRRLCCGRCARYWMSWERSTPSETSSSLSSIVAVSEGSLSWASSRPSAAGKLNASPIRA
mmetsp:Transcript_35891/g.92394  ORF Transcript_35891/g.92394 Transcript_35891/m.92394 type:complete len:210 (+) Transcript_35891:143-772(+)